VVVAAMVVKAGYPSDRDTPQGFARFAADLQIAILIG